MRSFDSRTSVRMQVDNVHMARWEQYALGSALPFGAMWYSVPAGQSSPRDLHPEAELSLVLSGAAEVEAGGRTVRVAAGSAFLLDSNEAHIVHNRSLDEPLLVFSAYWMPAEAVDVEVQVA